MTELSRLIAHLQKGIASGASYVKGIKYPELLVMYLKELNDLIGNDKVKDSMATQISHLIMIKRRALENPTIKEDEVMLNTVLYGPPGVGKTLVGTKLAKIWYSLGYLDGSRNIKEKKQEIGDLLKDIFGDSSSGYGNDETAIVVYTMLVFIIIFFTIASMIWSMYSRLGGIWTFALVSFAVLLIFLVWIFLFYNMVGTNSAKDSKDIKGSGCKGNSDSPCGVKNTNKTNEYGNSPVIGNIVADDQIIKVVTRADFVDRYVGWTSPKTIKLLEENLGKVLFVDEAYSLINGPHDEFGMEALTALNLFLSQRPKEIIVIFAGYKDLLQTGVYSVQPGLKRRFMWQFDCNGYTPDQLFRIFKMQLYKKGWGVSDDDACADLVKRNIDAFPAYGGDTERLAFFAELEHSRDYIANKRNMAINIIEPIHIERGIIKLRENNIKDTDQETDNPLANMMKLISGRSKNKVPYEDSDQELIDAVASHSASIHQR